MRGSKTQSVNGISNWAGFYCETTVNIEYCTAIVCCLPSLPPKECCAVSKLKNISGEESIAVKHVTNIKISKSHFHSINFKNDSKSHHLIMSDQRDLWLQLRLQFAIFKIKDQIFRQRIGNIGSNCNLPSSKGSGLSTTLKDGQKNKREFTFR